MVFPPFALQLLNSIKRFSREIDIARYGLTLNERLAHLVTRVACRSTGASHWSTRCVPVGRGRWRGHSGVGKRGDTGSDIGGENDGPQAYATHEPRRRRPRALFEDDSLHVGPGRRSSSRSGNSVNIPPSLTRTGYLLRSLFFIVSISRHSSIYALCVIG